MPHRPIVIRRLEIFRYDNPVAAFYACQKLKTPETPTRDGYSCGEFSVIHRRNLIEVSYLSGVAPNSTDYSEAEAKLCRTADRVTFSEAFTPKADLLQPIPQ